MTNKFFSVQTGNFGTLISIFGLKFAFNVWGNCFSPAICFHTGPAYTPRGSANPIYRLGITLRSKRFTETTFNFFTDFNFHWAFNWNSQYLARKFGTFHDSDFGGYHLWRGHIDL